MLDAPGTPASLIGHIARANPLYDQLQYGQQVLVIFQAENGSISPNWSQQTRLSPTSPNVELPRVHIHGTVRLHDDKKWVLGAVEKLTRTHEMRTQAVHPHAAGAWKIKDAQADYSERQLGNIVGIDVNVQRIEAKFKLSQNRTDKDRASAATQVSAAGHTALGSAMQRPGKTIAPTYGAMQAIKIFATALQSPEDK